MGKNNQHIEVAPEAKQAPKFIFGKGWSLMNILIGAVFFAVGFIIYAISVIFGLSTMGDSSKPPIFYYILLWLGIAAIGGGILGFWLVIPAFQKWWHTKKWLALIFLVIGIVIGLLILGQGPKL